MAERLPDPLVIRRWIMEAVRANRERCELWEQIAAQRRYPNGRGVTAKDLVHYEEPLTNGDVDRMIELELFEWRQAQRGP